MPSTLEGREDAKLDLVAELLRRGVAVRLKAWGTSMLPSLWPGDLLAIQSATSDEVAPGDIVLVMRDERFFVHRVVEQRQCQDCSAWITRGDAMPHDDPPVAAFELLGRVVSVQRANRSFAPCRRLSPLQCTLAWMMCHWDRFRGLTLRIHAALPQAGPMPARQPFRGFFGTVRGILGTPPFRTSHP